MQAFDIYQEEHSEGCSSDEFKKIPLKAGDDCYSVFFVGRDMGLE